MKKLIYITIFILFTASSAFAVDFYPEMGMDPFYSSLNPQYVQPESDSHEQNTLMDFFKKKSKENKEDISNIKDIEQLNDEINKVPVNNKQDDNNITEEHKKEVFVRPKNVKELEEDDNESVEKTSLKEKLFFFKKKKEIVQEEQKTNENASIQLSADYMEYFPDRYEIEAIGNAKVEFTKNNTILSANKIVFNYDRNIVKAKENVILVSNDSVTEGDFIKLDLSKPDGWIDNPVTTTDDIKISAKEAFIYSDKIEEFDGVAKVLRNDVVAFRANSFASYVDQGGIFKNTYSNKNKETNHGVYTLKANTIYIDSKEDHDVITIKNADLYLKKFKIASIPSAKIVSNKQNTVVESNMPEIGSQSLLGAHVGPAVVLNVPGGSTLKLAPILTYADDKLGFGAIARYRNSHNMTEIAYGTSEDKILIRGKQKLANGLTLNYSRLTNENEWFLGYRKPKYSANLVYTRSDYVKDLKLNFSQQYSAGLFVDNRLGHDFSNAETRFRWMTQTFKPLYNYKNEEGNIRFNTGLVAQTAASVYSTGDVLGLFRIGPSLNTQVGPWTQSLMYLQTASAGESPFYFDAYRYGRSNFIVIESLRVSKYLSLGYLASLAMNRDNVYDDKLFQENRFFVSLGPDYARVSIGYDAYRQNTMLYLSMLVGTKDSEISFKKTVIQNPDKIGKTKKKKKEKKKNYKKYVKQKV